MPRDPVCRREAEPGPARRRRPGGWPRGPHEGSPVHPVPPRPGVLPLLLPERGGRTRLRGRDGRRAARRRDRRRLRPRPGRGQQPGKPGDRGQGVFRCRGDRRAAGRRLRERLPRGGRRSRGETFPGTRRHLRRLPRGAARCPRVVFDPLRPRAAPVPPRRPGRDPGPDDRPRGLPGAGSGCARDAVGEDPPGAPPRADAVPRRALLRRARDEGDRGPFRGGGCGGPRRLGRVRRGARVPGGRGAGGGGLGTGAGSPRQRYLSSVAWGGGEAYGTASGVGGVERTASAGSPGGGVCPSSRAGSPAVGALGKCRANISGR